MNGFFLRIVSVIFILLSLTGCGGGGGGSDGGFFDAGTSGSGGGSGGSSGASGASLYASLCQGCHGSRGDGSDGSSGVGLNSPPSNLVAYITANMPQDDADSCVGVCASLTASYINQNFVTAGGSQPEPDALSRTRSMDWTCSTVIGGTNARLWFIANDAILNANERLSPASQWQLLFQENATLATWADPNFEGWSKLYEPPCQRHSDQPIRAVLDVSTPQPQPVAIVLADQIDQTITVIQQKYSSVREIILLRLAGSTSAPGCGLAMSPAVDDELSAALNMFPGHTSTDIVVLQEYLPGSTACTE